MCVCFCSHIQCTCIRRTYWKTCKNCMRFKYIHFLQKKFVYNEYVYSNQIIYIHSTNLFCNLYELYVSLYCYIFHPDYSHSNPGGFALLPLINTNVGHVSLPKQSGQSIIVIRLLRHSAFNKTWKNRCHKLISVEEERMGSKRGYRTHLEKKP